MAEAAASSAPSEGARRMRLNVSALMHDEAVCKFLVVVDEQAHMEELMEKVQQGLEKQGLSFRVECLLNGLRAVLPDDEAAGDVLRDSEEIFAALQAEDDDLGDAGEPGGGGGGDEPGALVRVPAATRGAATAERGTASRGAAFSSQEASQPRFRIRSKASATRAPRPRAVVSSAVCRPATATRAGAQQLQSFDPKPCDLCRRVCRGWRGLAAHRKQAHGIKALGRSYCTTQVCPACGADFGTRPRALHHLQYSSAACRRKLIEGQLEMRPKAEVDEADRRDTELTREDVKAGRGRCVARTAAEGVRKRKAVADEAVADAE